jgi:hypothetical protein
MPWCGIDACREISSRDDMRSIESYEEVINGFEVDKIA